MLQQEPDGVFLPEGSGICQIQSIQQLMHPIEQGIFVNVQLFRRLGHTAVILVVALGGFQNGAQILL